MQWDEGPCIGGPHGPYRQSDRKHIYSKIANYLIEKGYAYHCFCSVEELSQKRTAARQAHNYDERYDGTWRNADPVEVQRRLDNKEPYAVRFRVPPGKIVSVLDKVKGRVTWDADRCLGDFIIMRSNGMPVYNFCVAVDDMDMQITHVIRAHEHLTNTLRQLLVLEALDYTPPTYAHCTILLGSDGAKLSKRHGAASVSQFREQGYLPEAIVSYLGNFANNHRKTEEEKTAGKQAKGKTPPAEKTSNEKVVYSVEEIVEAFSLEGIVKGSSVFDIDKLKHINRAHINAMSSEQLRSVVVDQLLKDATSPDGSPLPSVLSPEYDKHGEHSSHVEAFLAQAAKIALRDMVLTADVGFLVGRCLRYDLLHSLEHNSVAREVSSSPFFALVGRALARDHASGAVPSVSSSSSQSQSQSQGDFSERWNEYTKRIGEEVGLRRPEDYDLLLKILSLCLSGDTDGPELGEFMRFMSTVEAAEVHQILNPEFNAVFMTQRMALLND
eukprot:gene30860-38141_t